MRKLAILIPSLDSRADYLQRLLTALDKQIKRARAVWAVQIVILQDNGTKSIGQKRNELLQEGCKRAEYVAFFDDDDMPADNYISELLKGIETGADCCSLRGVMLTNGENPELFEHSIKYNAWKTTNNPIKYERYPNHLNCIKSSIAKQFKYPEVDHGEDKAFSDQLHKSGLIKTEHFINNIIYTYLLNTKK